MSLQSLLWQNPIAGRKAVQHKDEEETFETKLFHAYSSGNNSSKSFNIITTASKSTLANIVPEEEGVYSEENCETNKSIHKFSMNSIENDENRVNNDQDQEKFVDKLAKAYKLKSAYGPRSHYYHRTATKSTLTDKVSLGEGEIETNFEEREENTAVFEGTEEYTTDLEESQENTKFFEESVMDSKPSVCSVSTSTSTFYLASDFVEEQDMKETSYEETVTDESSKTSTVIDIFKQSDFGEPMRRQHLRLDFTPKDGADDNEYNILKCMAFWQFLDEHPELNHMKVNPEAGDFKDFEASSSSKTSSSTEASSSTAPCSSTELSSSPEAGSSEREADIDTSPEYAIGWIKEPEIAKACFATKPVTVYCENEVLNSTPTGSKDHGSGKLKAWRRGRYAFLRTGRQKRFSQDKKKNSPGSSPTDIKHLVAEMEAWDLNHPRSLASPRLVPFE